MIQVVDYLERGGYNERTPDPCDRRAKLIRITERDRGLTITADQILRDAQAEVRAALDDERLQELRLLLQELVDAVARHEPQVEQGRSGGRIESARGNGDLITRP